MHSTPVLRNHAASAQISTSLQIPEASPITKFKLPARLPDSIYPGDCFSFHIPDHPAPLSSSTPDATSTTHLVQELSLVVAPSKVSTFLDVGTTNTDHHVDYDSTSFLSSIITPSAQLPITLPPAMS